MAASITIEVERGTYARSPHPHNGYYAGDFGPRAGRGATPSAGSARSRSPLADGVPRK